MIASDYAPRADAWRRLANLVQSSWIPSIPAWFTTNTERIGPFAIDVKALPIEIGRQRLEIESNCKLLRRNGEPLECAPCMVIPGANSFDQFGVKAGKRPAADLTGRIDSDTVAPEIVRGMIASVRSYRL